jgi:alanine racemase
LLDLAEAKRLRETGWQGSILLLEGLFAQEDLFAMRDLACDCVVHEWRQVDWLENMVDAPQFSGARPHIYLKMNTGMNRLGFRPDDYLQVWQRLHGLGFDITHMTHFANADYDDRQPSVDAQYQTLEKTVADLPGLRTVANSATLIWHPQIPSDWVRPGIMLYGASPSGASSDIEGLGLKPTMSLRSEVIALQHLSAGESVGYGSRYKTDVPIRIAVVACGYADGYPRHAADGTPVWVSGPAGQWSTGRSCPMAGQVSMDMITIDVSDAPWVDVGTPVELFGQYLAIDDVANASGTIGYELMCAIAQRVPYQIR